MLNYYYLKVHHWSLLWLVNHYHYHCIYSLFFLLNLIRNYFLQILFTIHLYNLFLHLTSHFTKKSCQDIANETSDTWKSKLQGKNNERQIFSSIIITIVIPIYVDVKASNYNITLHYFKVFVSQIEIKLEVLCIYFVLVFSNRKISTKWITLNSTFIQMAKKKTINYKALLTCYKINSK